MTAIDDKWTQAQWIGAPFDAGAGSHEGPNPDGRGTSRDFANGSIYWTQGTGAHEVHGRTSVSTTRGRRTEPSATCGRAWAGSEVFLGYPTTDEMGPGDNRSNRFQHGHVSWTPTGGAVAHHSTLID
ncbi:hypothetical protein [Streptomyces sp. NPDC001876]|uniref:LGFP repeat-containing protein n=1 Tax=Streptomyces sp. NPDC001876 TaxID=3154402 RepID=UPI00332A619F